jgi:hypothetical protein
MLKFQESRKFWSLDHGLVCTFFLFGLWDYWHCGHSWPIVPASDDSEDDCGEQMECRLAGETEVLGENLPQCHFCPSQNPTCLGPVSKPGPQRWEAGD